MKKVTLSKQNSSPNFIGSWMINPLSICDEMINYFEVNKNNLSFNVTKAKNFIDGYTSVRKLDEKEKNNIKVLSQGAALRFLLTRVFDALNTVEGAIVKIKDPIEYLKRLEFHKNSKNYEDYFF